MRLQETRENIVLIGGQALFVWVLRYREAAGTDTELVSITSRDIDYIARSINDIRLCARLWDANLEIPDADNHTPHAAIVRLVDVTDKPVKIDFLETMLGFENRQEVINGAEPLILENATLYVMNPIHCVKSRTYNLYRRPYTDNLREREKIRIKCAIKICRLYILELLDDGRPDRAVAAANYLVKFGRSQLARRLAKDGINVMDGVPEDQERWPDPHRVFVSKTLMPTKNRLALLGRM